jgi:hypothetical protein
MQVGFGGAFSRAFAVTGHHHSLQIRASSSAIHPAAAVQSTPCGVMLSSAMTQAIPISKIDEITIHNLDFRY